MTNNNTLAAANTFNRPPCFIRFTGAFFAFVKKIFVLCSMVRVSEQFHHVSNFVHSIL